MIEVSDHVCVLGLTYTCHTLNTTDIVLSCFPPSLPHFRILRPHTCISSGCQGYRFVLRRLHVTSYTYRYQMRWCHESAVTAYKVTRNKRRLWHIHVKMTVHTTSIKIYVGRYLSLEPLSNHNCSVGLQGAATLKPKLFAGPINRTALKALLHCLVPIVTLKTWLPRWAPRYWHSEAMASLFGFQVDSLSSCC
jgi:hypothetical protein